jgi:hypothetical protein
MVFELIVTILGLAADMQQKSLFRIMGTGFEGLVSYWDSLRSFLAVFYSTGLPLRNFL